MSTPRPVWVDTDLALGARAGDVDDGWALAAVLCAPGLAVKGVSSVFGNTAATTATRCARALLEAAGAPGIPVVPGADRAGVASAAAEALAALPAGTSVLALGPLTNVAAALARDRDLAARVDLRFVGGNLRSRGRWPPLWPFEFNLAKDPAAARAVLASPTPRRVFTLDVCAALTVGPGDLLRASRASPLGDYLARGSWRWLAYAPLRYRALAFPLWDLVPALDLAGVLPHGAVTRRVGLRGRGLLVDDPSAPATVFVRDIDVGAAREALHGLVRGAVTGAGGCVRRP